MRTDTQANKIVSKVRSAKDNIIRVFRTNGLVAPSISNLDAFVIPGVHQYRVQDVHSSPPLLTSISQSPTPRGGTLPVLDPLLSRKTGLETRKFALLVIYRDREAEERVEDFVFILRSVAEVPSPSSSVHLLTPSHRLHTLPSTFYKVHTNEDARNSKVDAEGMYMEPSRLAISSSCAHLRASDSEARYDAILAAEFAAFSPDSGDILEWSDKVEREKQARMDAHFAYVSEALAVPVPKLSAYLTDSPADFNVDTNRFGDDPSPLKTESLETNTSSADSSLLTITDTEESRPSLTIVRGLRRVRNHADLRVRCLFQYCTSFLTLNTQNPHLAKDCSDSWSDLSNWSLDLGLSDSAGIGTKQGALRRSVRCNDLRVCFPLGYGHGTLVLNQCLFRNHFRC